MEQTNEVMEVLGRPYGVPEDVDEDDLEAGGPVCVCVCTCMWMCGLCLHVHVHGIVLRRSDSSAINLPSLPPPSLPLSLSLFFFNLKHSLICMRVSYKESASMISSLSLSLDLSLLLPLQSSRPSVTSILVSWMRMLDSSMQRWLLQTLPLDCREEKAKYRYIHYYKRIFYS